VAQPRTRLAAERGQGAKAVSRSRWKGKIECQEERSPEKGRCEPFVSSKRQRGRQTRSGLRFQMQFGRPLHQQANIDDYRLSAFDNDYLSIAYCRYRKPACLGMTNLAPRRGPSQEAPECSSTPMAPSVVMTFTRSKWHGTVLDSWTFQSYYLSYLRIEIRSAQIRSWHVMLSISWLDSASLDPLLASCLPPLPRMVD
jgi:hypothetical protein